MSSVDPMLPMLTAKNGRWASCPPPTCVRLCHKCSSVGEKSAWICAICGWYFWSVSALLAWPL